MTAGAGRALARTLRRVADRALRAGYVRGWLAERDVTAAAAALDELCLAAEAADPECGEALVAVVEALADPRVADDVTRLREEAAGGALVGLSRLLRRPPPLPSRALSPARPPDYGGSRPLTLGERKALARRPTRAHLEKLLLDPDPMVLEALLMNPRLTEDDVLTVAAKRPGAPALLAVIARSGRWSVRARVRMALALNPEVPPELGVPLVSLLSRQELRLVLEVTDACPAVRGAARELLLRRPPQLRGGPGDDEEPM
ncbi:MAG: hypothetical protein IT374_01310 [Polyangiaceae bacterium]|nr:hypothetical protein [Polyangiaceae bacterium]